MVQETIDHTPTCPAVRAFCCVRVVLKAALPWHLQTPDNMDIAEAFLKRIFRDALERCGDDMQFFNERIDESHTLIANLQHIIDSKFVRLPYTEAIDRLQKSGATFEFPVA